MPEKVLTLLCAWRNIKRDTLATTTLEAIAPLLGTQQGPYALGGADAANAHLGGMLPVLGHSQHIVYLPKSPSLADLPAGDEVTVLAMDRRAQLDWDGLSSIAQTLADLFATPGWQATEIRLALSERYVPARDWHQRGDDDASTKIAALLDCPDTEKGEKDAREIIRLMREDERAADGVEVVRVLLDTTAGPKEGILDYVRTLFELLPNKAGLNKADRRWLDGLRREWLDEAERQIRRATTPPSRPRLVPN